MLDSNCLFRLSARFLHYVRSTFLELIDTSPRNNWSLTHRKGVIRLGSRAYTLRTTINGKNAIKKIFCRNREAYSSFCNELDKFKKFKNYSWCTVCFGSGKNWFRQPWYLCEEHLHDAQLDIAVTRMDTEDRYEIALKILEIILDMHSHRVAHRDFHAKHIFYLNGDVKIIDFDASIEYPVSYNPKFYECYDICGQGLESPFYTGNMGYFANRKRSVAVKLDISHKKNYLLDELKRSTEENFNQIILNEESNNANNWVQYISHPQKNLASHPKKINSLLSEIKNYQKSCFSSIKILCIGSLMLKDIMEVITIQSCHIDWILPTNEKGIVIRRWIALNNFFERVFFVDPEYDKDLCFCKKNTYQFILITESEFINYRNKIAMNQISLKPKKFYTNLNQSLCDFL